MAITEKFEVQGDVRGAEAAIQRLRSTADKGMSGIERKAGDAGKAITEKLSGSMLGSVTAANLLSNAVVKAFSVISASIDASVQSALDYERTMVTQAATLRLFAVDVQGANSLLESQSTVLERLTGLAQEDIRTMQNRAIALGESVSGTDDLVRASLALANVMGKNVSEVMNQILKAQSGMLDETLRQIPALQKLTKEQLQSGEAIAVINREYGDFVSLATEGGGSAANLAKLSTAWGNLGKAIARAALESELAREQAQGWSDWAFVMQKQVEGGQWINALSTMMGKTPEALKKQADAYRELESAQAFLDKRRVAMEEFERAQMGVTIDAVTIKVKDQTEQVKKAARAFDRLVNKWGELPGEAEMLADLRRSQGLISGTPEFVGPMPTLADTQQGMHLELERQAADGMREIWESNAARRVGVKMWEADEIARITEASTEMQMRSHQTMADVSSMAISNFAATGLRALEMLAEGAEVSGAALVRSVLASVGRQTLGMGIAHMAQAGAMLFNPATTALGIALMKSAGIEIAVGSALMAGNLAMAAGGVGTSLSPATGAGGGAGAAGATGAVGGGSVAQGGGSGPMSTGGITVVINGPTFATEEEIGVAISRAQQAARARGLIE